MSPFFLLPKLGTLAVPEKVPPPSYTSLSVVRLLLRSVLTPFNGSLSLVISWALSPFTVTSPPIWVFPGFKATVPFAVFSRSITSPTSPWIPPPLDPIFPPTIAPPASRFDFTSSTFTFPPIVRFPFAFPVSDPKTPPFRFRSPSIVPVISFLTTIPAWLFITSPFL